MGITHTWYNSYFARPFWKYRTHKQHMLASSALVLTYWISGHFKNIKPRKLSKQIDDYVDKVKELYDVGAKTVLTTNVTGDHETFYYHVLRFYIPKIAQETCNKYGLGIGIYTMQGFERRNKESKNILKRFSNNVGNITIPNLKRIWDIFQHSKNVY